MLSQTFRAIIHSRMKVGMEKYRRQYPLADVVLFEPDREDADMFFANIFSYSQRKHLCAAAYRKTRQNLISRAEILAPQLDRHGITLAADRLHDPKRTVIDAVTDPGRCTPTPRVHAGCGRRRAIFATRSTSSSAGSPARTEAPPFASAAAAFYTRRVAPLPRFPPWRKRNGPAARASAFSKRASTSSIASASRTSRRPTSPAR